MTDKSKQLRSKISASVTPEKNLPFLRFIGETLSLLLRHNVHLNRPCARTFQARSPRAPFDSEILGSLIAFSMNPRSLLEKNEIRGMESSREGWKSTYFLHEARAREDMRG